MDWLGKTSFRDGMPRKPKRALLRPNAISFLPPLADDSLMAGTAVLTPPILYPTGKSAKIGEKCKIIHSKYC